MNSQTSAAFPLVISISVLLGSISWSIPPTFAEPTTHHLHVDTSTTTAQIDERESVKKIQQLAKSIRQSASGLADELNRPNMVQGMGPNVVGSMVIPAAPQPDGLIRMGNKPPRPQALRFMVNDMGSKIEQLVTEELQLDGSPLMKEERTATVWGKIKDNTRQIRSATEELSGLLQDARFSSREFSAKVLEIYDASKTLERTSKSLINKKDKTSNKNA